MNNKEIFIVEYSLHFSSNTAALGSADIGRAVSHKIIVVGETAARKSSKHNGRFILKSRSPFSPYRLEIQMFFVFYKNKFYYLISHKVLLITTRSGFSESFLNSSNIRYVTLFRHLKKNFFK